MLRFGIASGNSRSTLTSVASDDSGRSGGGIAGPERGARGLPPGSGDEGGERLPDFLRGVFLEEVGTADRCLFLVLPSPAELALGAGEDHPGSALTKSFGISLSASQRECPSTTFATSLGSLSIGSSRGQTRIGRPQY